MAGKTRLRTSAVLWAAAVLAGGAASAQAAPIATPAPDAIYYDGKVVTVDPAFSIRRAFAITGDSFTAVGSDAEVLRLAGPRTRRVDLHGATVIPGLADAHDHLYAIERLRRGLDLTGATTTAEIVRRLGPAVAAARPGEVVFASTGWRAPIARRDLDALAPGTPVVLYRMRRGPFLMNGAALARLDVSKAKPGLFPVDAAGEPTGEAPPWPYGLYAADRLVPASTPQEEEDFVLRGQKVRNALGITHVRDLSNQPGWAQAYLRVWAKHQLTVRLSLGASLPDAQDPLAMAQRQWIGPVIHDQWLNFDTLGEEPSPESLSPAAFAAFCRDAARLGWRVSPHVDDTTLDTAIAGYEAADRDRPLKGRRWVIEHMPGITPPQMDRLARLGAIVSIQTLPSTHYPELVKSLGQTAAEREVPAREMLDHGLTLISGTDVAGNAPEGDAVNNPFIRMYFYTTRRTPAGELMGPKEAVSRADALRFATLNFAYANFDEATQGSIEPGKLADFVILSGDYLTVPDAELLKLRPVATFVGGRKVFPVGEVRRGRDLGEDRRPRDPAPHDSSFPSDHASVEARTSPQITPADANLPDRRASGSFGRRR